MGLIIGERRSCELALQVDEDPQFLGFEVIYPACQDAANRSQYLLRARREVMKGSPSTREDDFVRPVEPGGFHECGLDQEFQALSGLYAHRGGNVGGRLLLLQRLEQVFVVFVYLLSRRWYGNAHLRGG